MSHAIALTSEKPFNDHIFFSCSIHVLYLKYKEIINIKSNWFEIWTETHGKLVKLSRTLTQYPTLVATQLHYPTVLLPTAVATSHHISLKDQAHQTDIKTIAAIKINRGVTSHCPCLGQKVSFVLEHTAKTTVVGQLACTFSICVRGNNAPCQEVAVFKKENQKS